MSSIGDEKKALRRALMARRAAMPFDRRAAADAAITETVLAHPAYQAAKQVFCYVSMPHEVSTRALLAAALRDGKVLGLPVCNTADSTMTFYRLETLGELKTGEYRIPVPPVSAERKLEHTKHTLMIVPMLGFDAEGHRLGAGGGYYDRWLGTYQTQTLGICYADCRLEQLPHEAFDQKLMCCVTEQKTEDFYG